MKICIPVCRNLPLSVKLQRAQRFLCLQVELHQKIVVDVSREQRRLMYADCRGDVLFLAVLRLVDITVTIFRLDALGVSFNLEGTNSYF